MAEDYNFSQRLLVNICRSNYLEHLQEGRRIRVEVLQVHGHCLHIQGAINFCALENEEENKTRISLFGNSIWKTFDYYDGVPSFLPSLPGIPPPSYSYPSNILRLPSNRIIILLRKNARAVWLSVSRAVPPRPSVFVSTYEFPRFSRSHAKGESLCFVSTAFCSGSHPRLSVRYVY